MAYSLKIGEATIEYSEDAVRVGVEGARLESAPAFGEPTDHTNARWPSYKSWAEFCRDMGLCEIMGDRTAYYFEWNDEEMPCLMPEHPGAAPIRKAHLEYIQQRVSEYKAKHPDHIAEYPPPKPGAQPAVKGSSIYRGEDYVDDPRYDGNLCRAEWLIFWMQWALENCEKPVFVNT